MTGRPYYTGPSPRISIPEAQSSVEAARLPRLSAPRNRFLTGA